ncbi:MAG: electron transfer flavoprotein subunit alpha/FixB family protein [Trueperella sp.]|nr:electron transfer flavoprotein subunit alpha/FixB family protein [Trueperella sp.]
MKTWILTTGNNISQLLELAVGETVAVVVGDAPITGVDQIIRLPLPENMPAEALAPAVVQQVTATADDLILAVDAPAERTFAGAVAARLDAVYLHGLTEVSGHTAKLSRYSNLTLQSVAWEGPAVAVVEGGKPVTDLASAPETTVETPLQYQAQITAATDTGTGVNLPAAERIVGVGRGFAAEEDLQLARDFAAAIGAEVGCSRPIVEGAGWMDRDSYIGVSGHTISPEIYFPVGLSGQVHHLAGVENSKTIVAINEDETANIFTVADYGVVGDLYQILPELTAALGEA